MFFLLTVGGLGCNRFRIHGAWLVCAVGACLFHGTAAAVGAVDLTPQELLGKRLFFDKNLSTPAGQSCASCHAPETGFTGPDSQTNWETGIYPGAAPGRFGNRKPPSAAYAAYSPRRKKGEDGEYTGGQFWDGRADTLVEQAKGPFLNPLEMNNASSWEVVSKVQRSTYRNLFERVYGPHSLDVGPEDADSAFDLIARAIAAYESSREVNQFSSKYDAFLEGRARLSEQELRGLALFTSKAKCSNCHLHEPEDDGSFPLFTDFTYDNLGAPRNAHNPYYQADRSVNPRGGTYRDLGLGGQLNEREHWGQVKVPTLRNVAKRPTADFVKSYFHNGTMKSLKDVVRFYNRRDRSPEEFPPAEVPDNMNTEELGDLKLTDSEEDDVVAFLETLTDGYSTVDEPEPIGLNAPASAVINPAYRFRFAREASRVESFRLRWASGTSDDIFRR